MTDPINQKLLSEAFDAARAICSQPAVGGACDRHGSRASMSAVAMTLYAEMVQQKAGAAAPKAARA